MTRDWDELLSEPIGRLQSDAPAADGGWLALRPLEAVSPRVQEPPLTFLAPESILTMLFPAQPEEEPAGAPPPPSWTRQFRLTWRLGRQSRRRLPGDADAEPSWPEWTPPVPIETYDEAPDPAPQKSGLLHRLIELVRPTQPKRRDAMELQ